MSPLLLGVIAMLYVGVGVHYLRVRNWSMALVFFCYALANVGFIFDGWRR